MSINIKKKCSICTEYVLLEKDDVIYDKSYMHFNCYVQDKFNKKRNKLSIEQIKENSRIIQKENEHHVQQRILSEKFYIWLQKSYGIVVIPQYFFTKISSVVSGEYKGLSVGIPLENIFDMWQRKKQELDKIALNNIRKGNNIDSVGRLSYDLAVLIGKYDSYLKWKNQQIAMADNVVKEGKEQKIDFSKINKTIELQKQADLNNISDLLDEVF